MTPYLHGYRRFHNSGAGRPSIAAGPTSRASVTTGPPATVFGRVTGGIAPSKSNSSLSTAASFHSVMSERGGGPPISASHMGDSGSKSISGKTALKAAGVVAVGGGVAGLSALALTGAADPSATDPHSSYGIQPVGGAGEPGGTPNRSDLGGQPALNIETIQEETPEDINQYNTDFIEVPQSTGGLPALTPVEENYDMESIKSWFGRAFFLENVAFTTSRSIVIGPGVIESCSKGKLDYFRYFRADMVFTFRWNVPKTSFGALIMSYVPGDSVGNTINDGINKGCDFNVCKTFIDVQGSEATLTVPWFYFMAFYDRGAVFSLGKFANFGKLWIDVVNPVQSVNGSVVASTGNVYLSFANVSVLTPIPIAYPQGAVLAVLGTIGLSIGAGIATNEINKKLSPHELVGQNAMRIFNEGLNLLRIDGIDPAVPVARTETKFVPFGDSFAVTDYNQLGMIPTYQRLSLSSTSVRGILPLTNHAWYQQIMKIHPFVRADWGVRLHFCGTPFHSGRIRIMYLSTASDFNRYTGTQDKMAMGPSIVWDVHTDTFIDFVVPYGSTLEFNASPTVLIYMETPLTTAFDTVAFIDLVAEIVFTNVKVMGYRSYSTVKSPYVGSWDVALYPPDIAGFPVPEGTVTTGWYNAVHCLEDENDTSIATTARRAGPLLTKAGAIYKFDLPTNEAAVNLAVGGWLNGVNSTYDFGMPIAPLLSRCSGWRGSVKVSIIADDANVSLRCKPYWGSDTDAFGYTVNGAGFAEIVFPYISHDLFYGTRRLSWGVAVSGSAASKFAIWLSFMEDFELLWPTSLRTMSSTSASNPEEIQGEQIVEESTEAY